MIYSINPYTGNKICSFTELTDAEIAQQINKADAVYNEWKNTSFKERSQLMLHAAKILLANKKEYASTISEEMGKPIKQAIAEVEKCAWVCDYYAENAKEFLLEKQIPTDAKKSYVSFESLGVILAVMPWNYPFWQVFRFAAPALMAGNAGVLKHASSVMQSANNIQQIFEDAGFPKGLFQNLVIGSSKVDSVIKNPKIRAVTLTGSKPAGSAVASTAAKEIKKSVLELGGNNAFIVLKDANIDQAVEIGVNARYQNTGQSCIAAKRLLLHEAIAEEFTEKYIVKVKQLKSGDPLNEKTYIGVLARESLAEDLEKQVEDSLKMGAHVLLGGKRKQAYYPPTILTDVTNEMPVFIEETFGPVIAIKTFKTIEEAIEISNTSEFGLGVSLFTENIDEALKLVPRFQEGAVFINELVKSDPRLPFGGIKQSGYGRELGSFGIKEFVNIKTVYVK
ncbi:NAD-dependent succinate-semialdehyde dehydrogenase [Galbibacter pacificus]|uniref:NAD-dependent succinate-semialdehyde dehydrogenase n=1 Tax=Galbibacter pacificus TaxID=2996052 RepID=A0ABT6FR47_9FLAO|nr:NAD-dependent succinate-semialdehyde dehydrogenase [Galbibacter pacificus]MDG3581950.1 NAD-dependent succinate-semialdehyde dehydrogenase [Galbibacter pacificus]MDG3585576.1 NAD-dependent succinate-semialdehyde dehydrogenase [Galbibacter pacificus]